MSDPIEAELLQLERRYWQAMKDKDVDAIIGLTDFPCIVVGAQGAASIDQAQMSAMMQGANWEIRDFAISDDVQVRRLTDEAAALAYKVREDLSVGGEPLVLEAADSSVWVCRDGRWLCAVHTESLLGDPYGRDRRSG